MAAPSTVAITPADTWVLVAASVKAGKLTKGDTSEDYLHTWVDAGATAPSGLSTARPFDLNGALIKSDRPIDVYVQCVNGTGSMLVEL
jgi:hypothetical protein